MRNKVEDYSVDEKLLDKLFGEIQKDSNAPKSWDSPFKTCLSVFDNN